jgi:hypothetical protein
MEYLVPRNRYSLDRPGARPPESSGADDCLYRPVGQRELDLIESSNWRCFPARLDWQPIFYPVVTEDYALLIARDWNTKAEKNGNVGCVTAFAVESEYLRKYEIHDVGERELRDRGPR